MRQLFGNRAFNTVLLLLILLLGCSQGVRENECAIQGPVNDGVVDIKRGETAMARFSVAVADSPEAWRKGLMHCTDLAPATGMLFVYPQGGKRVFWMKNTLIELAIIFISADNRIAAIAHGRPQSLERIYSPENIRYVLEINFDESRELAVGDRVDLR